MTSTTPKILLAIDIQREYNTIGRPFHIANIEPSLVNAKALINCARQAEVPVWHIQHQQEKSIFVKGSEEADFIPGFEPLGEEPVYIKDLYSSFFAPEFADALAAAKPEEIMVIGYGASMCCLCTIIEGIQRGYDFTLIEDAVAAKAHNEITEAEMHSSAVNVLQQFAQVKRTEEVLNELS